MKRCLKRIHSWLNNSFTNRVSNFRRFRICEAAVFLLLFPAFFESCKKKDDIGLNIQPGNELLGLHTTDTASLNAWSAWVDSVRSDEAIYSLLGTYFDPVFGASEADLYTQVRLSTTNVDFGNVSDMEVDSVILSLVYSTYYGKLDPQAYCVYRVSEDIEKDSIYYSNRTFTVESGSIGGISRVVPNLEDSVLVDGIYEAPQLRIKMHKSFGDELLNAGASVYASNEDFIDFFKGFLIKPISVGTFTVQPDTGRIMPYSGTGAILTLDLTHSSSRLVLYYHDINSNEQFQYVYYINDKTARVNNFRHAYNGTIVKAAVDNPSTGELSGYVQPMAGVKTKIEIPFLQDFVSDRGVAVNRAELIIKAQNGASSTFPPPAQLYLTGIDSSGKSIFIADQFYNETYYGGDYDVNTDEYHFVITRHIQEMLNAYRDGEDKNYGLYLLAAGDAIGANRLILNGPQSQADPLRLIISYTPL
ncbi:MAG: DUF4270 family protein [Flavobacteriales bacterium]